jgi:lipopolysaccharide export system protein LptA
MVFRAAILLPFFLFLTTAVAQPDAERGARVEILNADEWSFDEQIAPGAQRLRGNVRFKHADAIMYCDSAFLYKDQRVEAFGSVRILQGDTLSIQADRLLYSGLQRTARLEGNVVLRDPGMELTTPSLDYDLREKRAVYTEGARIVSSEENNVLTSTFGTYHADARTFHFSRNVRLEHPDRIITTDTMHYGSATGIASFFGPTRIVQLADSSELNTRRGTYDTRLEKARFTRRSSIRTKGRLLEGDTLYYDRISGLGRAWGNVSMTDTTSNISVRGGHGSYNERTNNSMITGRAEMIMLLDGDSLFLHGDTLFTRPLATTDSTGLTTTHRQILARRNVRFFKSDMQGVCDTLVYSDGDSLLHMFHDPALWSGTDQITGEHIRITMRDGGPYRLHVMREAFLMSQADSTHFDQVTGNTMVGFFADGVLRRIVAEGNARTVYFARETKDGREELFGVNRADCSSIAVGLEEGKVNTVTFMERPDAVLYPLDKVPPEELRMKGAEWRITERPADREGIFDRQR